MQLWSLGGAPPLYALLPISLEMREGWCQGEVEIRQLGAVWVNLHPSEVRRIRHEARRLAARKGASELGEPQPGAIVCGETLQHPLARPLG